MNPKNDSHIPNPKGNAESGPVSLHHRMAMGEKETGSKDPNAGVKATGPSVGNAPKNY